MMKLKEKWTAMSHNMLLGLATFTLFGVASCSSEKKTSETVDLKGTYQVMLPAADGPGHYLMVAFNGNHYQLFEKYLSETTPFVSMGEVSNTTDSTFQVGELTFLRKGNDLLLQDSVMQKLSEDTLLQDMYVKTYMKADKTGENIELSIMRHGEKKLVALKKADKQYTLNYKEDSNDSEVYSDGKVTLMLKQGKELTGTMDDGTKTTLTLLTPTTRQYKGTGNDEVYYEALYYTGEVGGTVHLFGADLKHSYILPQKEAAAHAAEYSDGKTTWKTDPNANATLTSGGKTVKLQAVK